MCGNQGIEKLHDIVKEYRNDDGICITREDIIRWGNQFGEDSDFIISETAHLFSKIYFNRDRIIEEIQKLFDNLVAKHYDGDWGKFSACCSLLNLQNQDKSQPVYVKIGNEIINSKINPSIHCDTLLNKKLYIYLDDLLATGGTLKKTLLEWIKKHAKELDAGTIDLVVYHTCANAWEFSNRLQSFQIILTEQYGNIIAENIIRKKIMWKVSYIIENHILQKNANYNLVKPICYYSQEVENYHNTLAKTPCLYGKRVNAEYTLRDVNKPAIERLFTCPGNRNRYEKLILLYSYSIMKDAYNINNKPQCRPLGFTSPHYATLGCGCLFFTWRNAPNNMPLVYWLKTNKWFPLLHRNYTSYE